MNSLGRWASRGLALLLLAGLVLAFFPPSSPAVGQETGTVVVVPVTGTVELGLKGFLERSIREAAGSDAGLVLLEINTLGGRIDAALAIRDTILESPVPVAVLIKNRALSAGALIAIAADHLYMQPGSSIGAAEPRPAEEKIVSAWRAEMEDTAELRGRDPQVAAAMVDKAVEIPGLVEKGRILTLTASQAEEISFVDGVVAGRGALLRELDLGEATVRESSPTTAELAARWVTHPYVAPLLLTVGFLGVAAELLLPGFGAPGIIGLLAFFAYFAGHSAAGFGGWTAVALFVGGFIALIVEVIVPGFGIFGIGGIVMILASIFLTSTSPGQAALSILLALGATVLLTGYLVRNVKTRGIFSRLLLSERQGVQSGYVAPRSRAELVGKEGVAVTPLHPAGTADIEGDRFDVVSEGGYVAPGSRIRVVQVEGARIVVRPVDQAHTSG